MREIKFKGRTKDNKWIFGNVVSYDEKDKKYYIGNSQSNMTEVEHLCQFTGLKDNRGNDIYEWDIFDIDGDFKRVIKYDEAGARFVTVRLENYGDHKRRYTSEDPDKSWWEYFKKDIHVIDNLLDLPEFETFNPEED